MHRNAHISVLNAVLWNWYLWIRQVSSIRLMLQALDISPSALRMAQAKIERCSDKPFGFITVYEFNEGHIACFGQTKNTYFAPIAELCGVSCCRRKTNWPRAETTIHPWEYCGMWLLIHNMDTCYWCPSSHIYSYVLMIPFRNGFTYQNLINIKSKLQTHRIRNLITCLLANYKYNRYQGKEACDKQLKLRLHKRKKTKIRGPFKTHWGQDKMTALSQTTVSRAFSCMKIHEFRLTFHLSLFLKVKLTIFQHWFR